MRRNESPRGLFDKPKPNSGGLLAVSPRRRLLVVGLVVLAAAVWSVVEWYRRIAQVETFRFDDVYITLRYARNLVEHGHLSFNLDDQVDGYTSPGWTLLMAAGMAVGLDGESLAMQASRLFGWLAIPATIWLARTLRVSWPLAVLAAIVTISVPGFVVWSSPGMETSYVATSVTLLSAARLSKATLRAHPRFRWVTAMLALICLTARPECALFYGLLATGWLWEWTRRGASAAARADLRPQLAVIAVFVGLFAWHWVYYGYPLPNTYYAKQGSAALAGHGRAQLTALLIGGGWGLAPLLALVAVALRWQRWRFVQRHWIAVYLLWFAALGYVYSGVGGSHLGFHRFYQPLVPISAVALCCGLDAILQRLSTGPRLRWAVSAALVALVAIGASSRVNAELRRALPDDVGAIATATVCAGQWEEIGRELRDHFPASTSIAVNAAGLIPYLSGFRTFDVFALNNQDVAHSTAVTGDYPGHQKAATTDQVLAWEPDLILWHPYIDGPERPTSLPHYYRGDALTAAGYELGCIPLRRGTWHCFWARSD